MSKAVGNTAASTADNTVASTAEQTTADTPVVHPSTPTFRLARLRDFTLVPAIIVLMIVGAVISPVFLSSGNLINVLQQQT